MLESSFPETCFEKSCCLLLSFRETLSLIEQEILHERLQLYFQMVEAGHVFLKLTDEIRKVNLIEETFHARMFDTSDVE